MIISQPFKIANKINKNVIVTEGVTCNLNVMILPAGGRGILKRKRSFILDIILNISIAGIRQEI